jgi:hypothetical protein
LSLLEAPTLVESNGSPPGFVERQVMPDGERDDPEEVDRVAGQREALTFSPHAGTAGDRDTEGCGGQFAVMEAGGAR